MALGTSSVSVAQDDEALEEIVVTGSHIRRTTFEGRAPIQIVDTEEIALTGAAQPVEILKQLTVNSGSHPFQQGYHHFQRPVVLQDPKYQTRSNGLHPEA